MPSYTLEQLMRSPWARRFGQKRLLGTTLAFGTGGLYGGRIAENMGSAGTVVTTAGAVTYTTDQILSGLLVRNCNGTGRTDTTPTAAAICAALVGRQVNDTFRLVVISDNTATNGTGASITFTAGTGVTVAAPGTAPTGPPSTVSIGAGTAKQFLVQITSHTPGAEAVLFQALT